MNRLSLGLRYTPPHKMFTFTHKLRGTRCPPRDQSTGLRNHAPTMGLNHRPTSLVERALFGSPTALALGSIEHPASLTDNMGKDKLVR
ncbi:hypothetical protein KFU94_45270 [Chloroflexi bacterium TSY]|nr:hypothetical protein [Chloroflexi bacterium TSY]